MRCCCLTLEWSQHPWMCSRWIAKRRMERKRFPKKWRLLSIPILTTLLELLMFRRVIRRVKRGLKHVKISKTIIVTLILLSQMQRLQRNESNNVLLMSLNSRIRGNVVRKMSQTLNILRRSKTILLFRFGRKTPPYNQAPSLRTVQWTIPK